MSLPQNPFSGLHALAPTGGSHALSFVRTTPADPLSFSTTDLRILLEDRHQRERQAERAFLSARQEVHQVVQTIQHRHRLAMAQSTAAYQNVHQARMARDAAAKRCHDAHAELEGWWAAEAAKSDQPEAIWRLKKARADSLQRRTKPAVEVKGTKGSGVGKRTLKKKLIRVIPNAEGPLDV
ncbi:hypothetical protein B0H11DRAFT_2222709 [Mycena galericulata]|nr:hypothetical protein B0H11DRAFT_2222709 [Mycena galericulata]